MLTRVLALAIALAVLEGPASQVWAQTPSQPEFPSGWSPKDTQYANRDMVAAANPLAVEAGVSILAQGGSAIDAAIAVQMMLTLVEPQSSGIGGGAFLMHYDAGAKALVGYDGRETAPAAATPDQFMKLGKPLDFISAVTGGLSVGTPGVIRMMALAHARHGKLPWAALFQPAIDLADRGFPISPRLYTTLGFVAKRLCNERVIAAHYLKPDCTPKDEGSLLKNPELAATLRTIAADGADAFYSGPIAEAIVNAVRSHPTNPGRLSLQDLANYTPKLRPPMCGPYRGLRICGMPPESSGTLAVLQILGMLEHFDVAKYPPNSVDAVHLITEAYRLAYADRQKYVGDPDFLSVPVAGLLDPGYLRRRSALITMERSMGVPTAGTPPGAPPRGLDDSLSLPSTSHVSIVDKDGNMIAMTTTVESVFGSLQMVKGFILNNQLTDFSLTPNDADGHPVANRVEAGKRPRSSMAPTLVFGADDHVEAVVGSPGGSNIIQYVTKTLVGLIDWKLDIQQAIDLPNFGAQTSAVTELEQGTVLSSLRQGLAARGHTISMVDINSGLQGIVFNGRRGTGPAPFAHDPGKGRWAGGADPRREGTAKGHP
ncbi:MAG TPA: gamma-glutamyltransferase [Vicinamibacterales bacterium]|nr:gamma-glutamyltransferase [Vicinamibacterales bacterium]